MRLPGGMRAILAILVLLAGCSGPPAPSQPQARRAKPISFAILEDYDKGADLTEVARDFALFRQLGVTTWRGSFGWDDYEPEPGQYDFEWLRAFVRLAADSGIALRPYIGYTPAWAAQGGSDDQAWNDPPADLDAWAAFVDTLARTLRDAPNVLSWEIYNEENVPLWWDGTVAEYNAVLSRAAVAIRAADPDAGIIMGGLVWPDAEFVEASCTTHDNDEAFDIAAFHAYPETWTPDSVIVENYLDAGYHEGYLPVIRAECGGKPIWINETGFATTPGRTEREQANWWARAFATFLADSAVQHIGIYEIKDLPTDQPVIGDAPNYHLGLTHADRRPKLAFHTVRMLVDLFDTGAITVADRELSVRLTEGDAEGLHHHLFERPDGVRILMVWHLSAPATVDVTIGRAGSAARAYALDGTSSPAPEFERGTLRALRLTTGDVRVFVIEPN